MDSLIEIPRSKWAELRDLFKDNWPKNANAYCLLDYQISYQKLSETFNFKVYCPYGDMANGMVATSDRDGLEVMICPVKEIDKIEEALSTTEVIDFSKFLMIPFATKEVEDCLRRIRNLNGRMRGEATNKFILNSNSPKFENLSPPPNTYVAQIKPEHIKFIDEKWTYHGKNTYKLFEELMKNELTFALYSSEDQPLAWVTIDKTGALTHLYCIESERGKGYGEFILKCAVNDRLDKGKNILAYTLTDNYTAHKLFDKLKFDNIGFTKWLIIFKQN